MWARVLASDRAGHVLQCAGVPRGMALLQRAKYHRQILAVLFPITAFVAAGFEHSVANMYFVPMGLLLKSSANAEFWTGIGATASDFSALTTEQFLLANLLPVTLAISWEGLLWSGSSTGSSTCAILHPRSARKKR